MSLSWDDVSIVYWFPDRDKHRCGYCKRENCGISYGMWADSMTVDDYQDIIDRGWRRSGKYCYKPIMNETCCPQYTIRCDTTNFKISKSQKKVIKKFNKYLMEDILNSDTSSTRTSSTVLESEEVSHIMFKDRPHFISDYHQMDKKIKIDRIDPGVELKTVPSCSHNVLSGSSAPQVCEIKDSFEMKQAKFRKGDGPDPNKPRSQKAKQLRLERKRKKLLAKGLILESLQAGNKEVKTLSEYLKETSGDPKHKLEIRLVQMHANEESFELTAKLFEKYQTLVHNEKPCDCDVEQFQEFLVDSPLKAKTSTIDDSVVFGSYHQQYWIDGKLIAVGVIDILPRCISSVYFFYDPEYRSLTLGTYGSLREVEFVQRLSRKIPELKYYYMGFYIHSCSKMRYKGKLTPSELLCPETYDWFPIGMCISKLEASKYSRLNENPLAVDVECCTPNDIESIKILIGCQYATFRYYRYKSRDLHIYQTIGKLIGRKCINRFMFIQQKS